MGLQVNVKRRRFYSFQCRLYFSIKTARKKIVVCIKYEDAVASGVVKWPARFLPPGGTYLV